MKPARIFFLSSIFFLVMLAPSFAWNITTHQWLVNEGISLCVSGGMECSWLNDYRQYALLGTSGSGSSGTDYQNHHCYYQDCPAMKYAEDYYDRASKIEKSVNRSKEKAYLLGTGANYYTDAQEIWRQVSGEDYKTCLLPYEEYVNDYIFSDFSYNISCVLKDGQVVYEFQTKADMQEIARKTALYFEYGVTSTLNYADSNLLISQNISYLEDDNGKQIVYPVIPNAPNYILILIAFFVLYAIYNKVS